MFPSSIDDPFKDESISPPPNTPSPVGMDPLASPSLALDPEIKARLGQSKQDAREALMQRLRPGTTKKAKALGLLQDLFRLSMGAPTVGRAVENQVNKDYPDETSRLSQNMREQQLNQALQIGQWQAEQKRIHDAIALRLGTEKNAILQDLADTRGSLAQTQQSKIEEQARHNKAVEDITQTLGNAKLTSAQKVAELKARGQDAAVESYLKTLSPEERAQTIRDYEQLAAIRGIPGLMRNTTVQRQTSTGLDPYGNTVNSSTSVKNPSPSSLQFMQQLLGGQGGQASGGQFINPRFASPQPQQQPNPQVAPQGQAPEGQATAPLPQQGPTPSYALPRRSNGLIDRSGQAPQTGEVADESKYVDPLIPLPKGYAIRNKQIFGDRLKEKLKLTNEARDMDSSRNDAFSAAQAILDAVKSGDSKNFMGALKAQPIWQKAIGMFGERDPEQAFLSFLRPGMLLSTVRGNAGSSNRINQKEITMQDVGLGGNLLEKPENAIAGLLAHALHADTFGNQLRGSLGMDAETSNKATSANIAAIRRFSKELVDYQNLSPAQKLVTPAPKLPTSIVEEMKRRSDSGRELGGGATRRPPIDRDAVLQELRKRGVEAK